MENFVYCQINEPEFGSSTACAVRLDENGKIKDFVDCSTHDTNYFWDINFPPREELIGKSFGDLEELCNGACDMDEESYRTPYLNTTEIDKEDFMGCKLQSLTNNAKWFGNDGSTLSKSFLTEYNEAIPELKEFCDEKEFGSLQQIVAGLKIRDLKRIEIAKSSLEEKEKFITRGDSSIRSKYNRRVRIRKSSDDSKPTYETIRQQREKANQQVALNHYKNLRNYYGK